MTLARQTNVNDPQVAADARQGALVVWTRGPFVEGGSSAIYAVLRSDRGRFGAVQRLGATGGGAGFDMAPSGEAIVVWDHPVCSDGSDNCSLVMVAIRPAGSARFARPG